MNEVLIRTCFRLVCPMLGVISFYFFLRGHNLPGGGFIGGLILSLAFILNILSNKNSKLEVWTKGHFSKCIAICLFGLLFTALLPLYFDKPVLTGIWTSFPLPIAGKLSSILFFDFFIYSVVAVCTTRAYIEFTDFTGKGRLL